MEKRAKPGEYANVMERYYTAAQIGEILGGKSPRADYRIINDKGEEAQRWLKL